MLAVRNSAKFANNLSAIPRLRGKPSVSARFWQSSGALVAEGFSVNRRCST